MQSYRALNLGSKCMKGCYEKSVAQNWEIIPFDYIQFAIDILSAI